MSADLAMQYCSVIAATAADYEIAAAAVGRLSAAAVGRLSVAAVGRLSAVQGGQSVGGILDIEMQSCSTAVHVLQVCFISSLI